MVIGAFPIAKLSVLLIKQISKPIANMCKENAKHHPFFRRYVCMPPAQFYNWCEVKAKMWILNMGKPVNIPVLSQDMAIELGANLLGEAVIFTIGSVLLIIEYNRQSKKETAKEEKRQKELDDVSETIRELYFTVQQQQTQLKEMERIVLNLTSSKPKGPSQTTEPPEGRPPQPLPPTPESGTKPACPVKTEPKYTHQDSVVQLNTPYPDRGIILQALNYVQMDILNSNFQTVNRSALAPEHSKNTYRRDGVVMAALSDIENEHKSLF